MKSKNPKKEKNEKAAEAMTIEQAQKIIDELTNEKADLFDKLQRVSADYTVRPEPEEGREPRFAVGLCAKIFGINTHYWFHSQTHR